MLRRLPAGRFDPEHAADASDGIFGLPYREAECSVVLVPVPWEPTTSYGRGTSRGPSAIRGASAQLDLFDAELSDLGLGDPWAFGIHMRAEDPQVLAWNDEACRLARPILERAGRIGGDGNLERDRERVDALWDRLCGWLRAQVDALLDAGHLVGVVGGDHSCPFGAIAAHAARHPNLGLLHVDAHADLRLAYEGFVGSHASILRNVAERLPVGRIVQVALRDFSRAEADFARRDERFTVWTDAAIRRALASGKPWRALCEDIVATLPQTVYVTFDIDGLDPSLCPSTGTPVPGGLSFFEATDLLLELARQHKRVVGFDLCEVAPSNHPGDEWDANVGARILYRLAGVALHTHGARDAAPDPGAHGD
ncbi:MAG: agmatinase family protein [Myxococcota bacterium]|nr:agmatinase family protein [Myxococcota bacterium]MDW8361804.1 agmatinase family protein [Myxococcales bacterium]